jgi:hypothetical protein
MTQTTSVKVFIQNVGTDKSLHYTKEYVRKQFLVFSDVGAWLHSQGIKVTAQCGDNWNEWDGLDIELWADMNDEQTAEYYMRFR